MPVSPTHWCVRLCREKERRSHKRDSQNGSDSKPASSSSRRSRHESEQTPRENADEQGLQGMQDWGFAVGSDHSDGGGGGIVYRPGPEYYGERAPSRQGSRQQRRDESNRPLTGSRRRRKSGDAGRPPIHSGPGNA